MQNRKRNTPALVAGFAAIAGLSIATGGPALATAMPATGGPLTTEPPSHSPSTGTSVTETGVYLYQKLDPKKPAAWENSGEQNFLAKQPGHQWFTDISALVPSEVCGPGWGIQQDVLEFKGTYDWPKTLRYPDATFPGNPTLKDNKHQELGDLMTVPECETPSDKPTDKPTPKPTPSDTPSETPTDKPTEKPTPKPTPSDTPSETPTDKPTEKPTPKPTPSDKPSDTPSETPTDKPSEKPTPETTPSEKPSEKVTPEPTATPSPTSTPAGAVPPPGTDTTPPAAGTTDPRVPAAGTTDPRVSVAGTTDQRVPDAGLAHTGANGTWLAVAGAAVLALGAALVVIARRRKA